jgi:hypothetical protein
MWTCIKPRNLISSIMRHGSQTDNLSLPLGLFKRLWVAILLGMSTPNLK